MNNIIISILDDLNITDKYVLLLYMQTDLDILDVLKIKKQDLQKLQIDATLKNQLLHLNKESTYVFASTHKDAKTRTRSSLYYNLNKVEKNNNLNLDLKTLRAIYKYS